MTTIHLICTRENARGSGLQEGEHAATVTVHAEGLSFERLGLLLGSNHLRPANDAELAKIGRAPAATPAARPAGAPKAGG